MKKTVIVFDTNMKELARGENLGQACFRARCAGHDLVDMLGQYKDSLKLVEWLAVSYDTSESERLVEDGKTWRGFIDEKGDGKVKKMEMVK